MCVAQKGKIRRHMPRPAKLVHPTLALYRSILRAHQRHLPDAHREIGDAYVKSEFRLHRGASVRKRPRSAPGLEPSTS